MDFINEQAKKLPDKPELVPYVAGTIRGKKWIEPKKTTLMEEYGFEDDIELDIDLGKNQTTLDLKCTKRCVHL